MVIAARNTEFLIDLSDHSHLVDAGGMVRRSHQTVGSHEKASVADTL